MERVKLYGARVMTLEQLDGLKVCPKPYAEARVSSLNAEAPFPACAAECKHKSSESGLKPGRVQRQTLPPKRRHTRRRNGVPGA